MTQNFNEMNNGLNFKSSEYQTRPSRPSLISHFQYLFSVCKHLLFDAPWIGTYDRVCLKGFGMEQVITQLAVKIWFDDNPVFYEMRRTVILPEKQK